MKGVPGKIGCYNYHNDAARNDWPYVIVTDPNACSVLNKIWESGVAATTRSTSSSSSTTTTTSTTTSTAEPTTDNDVKVIKIKTYNQLVSGIDEKNAILELQNDIMLRCCTKQYCNGLVNSDFPCDEEKGERGTAARDKYVKTNIYLYIATVSVSTQHIYCWHLEIQLGDSDVYAM